MEIKTIETISRISGNIVDVVERKVFPGTIEISGGIISRIISENKEYSTYFIPGFIDFHVHIESSMLTPTEFAREGLVLCVGIRKRFCPYR